jgi:hypothetical protein
MKTIDAVKLDQLRADLIEELYARSGRTNGLYTGLWQDFCLELGAIARDTNQLQNLRNG